MFSKECVYCEHMIDCKRPVGQGCINFKGVLTKEVNNNTINVNYSKFWKGVSHDKPGSDGATSDVPIDTMPD